MAPATTKGSSFDKPFTVATVCYALSFAVTTYVTTSSANVRTGATLLMLALPAIMATEIVGVSESKALVDAWSKEFVGMAVMVFCTCGAGPAFGHLGTKIEWLSHWALMALADYSCGGPQVNPAVTLALFVAGGFGLTKTLVFVNLSAQLGGAIAGWLALRFFAKIALTGAVGGPSPDTRLPSSYLITSEFVACFTLVAAVFAFATTKYFKKAGTDPKIYGAKMTLINATVRSIILLVGATGPAINPALATGYAFVYADSSLPSFTLHYLSYWLGGIAGGLAMAIIWSRTLRTQKDSLKIIIAIIAAGLLLALWVYGLAPRANEHIENLQKTQWNTALKARHPLSKLLNKMPKNATPPPGITNAKLIKA